LGFICINTSLLVSILSLSHEVLLMWPHPSLITCMECDVHSKFQINQTWCFQAQLQIAMATMGRDTASETDSSECPLSCS